MRVTCVRGTQKRVGRGFYREVLRVGDIVLKVELGGDRDIARLRKRAAEVDSHHREICKKLDILPAYHGAVLAGVGHKGRVSPAVVTFHEYVKPISPYSVGALRAILGLISNAGERGYVLDLRPSNFGAKGKRLFYLDEYGVGKGPIPPDVLDDLNEFVQLALRKIRLKSPA